MLQDKKPPRADSNDPLSEAEDQTDQGLATQLLDALEQGVIFWSKSGACMMRNRRTMSLLDLEMSTLPTNADLKTFLQFCVDRGDFKYTNFSDLMRLYGTGEPFSYDYHLSAGRIVTAHARPTRRGGYIVSHQDVTDQRDAIVALDQARSEAELAQRKADLILEDERTRRREGRHLSNLDEWLQSCQTLEELYKVVSAFMAFVMPSTRGELFIYANVRDVLQQVCHWNMAGCETHHLTPNSCWALRRGRQYAYDKHVLSFPCDHVVKDDRPEDLPNQFLCVPIVAHGDTVGLLHLRFDEDGGNPDVLDPLAFASRCGERISMAIANVRLRDELQDRSDRDPLTGLFNRRVFLDKIRRALIDAAAGQTSFALLAIDADKFKPFNDNHGHDAGDAILQALADQMRKMDYPGATACRLGGEEFAVVLPNADRTRAGKAAEDLRQSIEVMRVVHLCETLPCVTVSIGISIYPTHGTEATDLIKQSDLALYAAKNAGRHNWKIVEGDGMISFE